WAGQMGGEGDDYPMSIAVDTSGNAYVTGALIGAAGTPADFDPGTGVFNLNYSGDGYGDIFLAKLNPSGGFEWAKGIGGGGADLGRRVVVDNFGHVFLAADIGTGTAVDFDPGPGVANVTGASALAEY